MADHTPTPWARSGNLIHMPGTGRVIKQRIGATFRYQGTAEANAAFIVRAVNAHDDLVKALEWIRTIADANLEQDDKLRSQGARTLKRIADKCDETLAKAAS